MTQRDESDFERPDLLDLIRRTRGAQEAGDVDGLFDGLAALRAECEHQVAEARGALLAAGFRFEVHPPGS